MKKNYIIPASITVAFHIGSICNNTSSDSNLEIGGGTLGSGGNGTGQNIEPM